MPSAAEELGQILATEAGDPVAILRLPRPELDALDRPTWQVDDATITRQWRKLSRCCHPDKNSTADAARAFQRLSEARDQLLNREERVVLLQAAAETLRTDRSRSWAGSGSASDESSVFRQRREEAKRLRQAEATKQAAVIRMHADERRERLDRALAAKHKRPRSGDDASDSSTAQAESARGQHGSGSSRPVTSSTGRYTQPHAVGRDSDSSDSDDARPTAAELARAKRQNSKKRKGRSKGSSMFI